MASKTTTPQFGDIQEPNMSFAGTGDGLMSMAGPEDLQSSGPQSTETTQAPAPAPVAPQTTPTTAQPAPTPTAEPTGTADVSSVVKYGMTSSQIASAFKSAYGRPITQAELQEAIKVRAGLTGTAEAQPTEMPTVEEPAIDTTPTTTRVTEKQNVDGTVSTETEQFSPEAQRLQEQLQQHYDLAKSEMDYAVMQFDKIQVNADAATTNLIKSIQLAYQVRIQQMEQVNKAGLNAQKMLGLRSGRSRYAPELQSSILTSEERAGIQRLTQLEAEKLSLIGEAQQAATDRDLKILNQRFGLLREARDEQTQIVKDMYGLARQEEERAQVRAANEMEMQRIEREFVEKKQGQYMDAIASDLVSLDDAGNIMAADFETIADFAEDFNLDPILLLGKVNARKDELQKSSIDERKLILDRRKSVLDELKFEFQQQEADRQYGLDVSKLQLDALKVEFEQQGLVGLTPEQIKDAISKGYDTDAKLQLYARQLQGGVSPGRLKEKSETQKKNEGIILPALNAIEYMNWSIDEYTGRMGFNDKLYKTAEETVSKAILRLESGAAITEDEAKNMKKLLPSAFRRDETNKELLSQLKLQLETTLGEQALEENKELKYSSLENFNRKASVIEKREMETFAEEMMRQGIVKESDPAHTVFDMYREQMGFSSPLSMGVNGSDVSGIKDFSKVTTAFGTGTATGIVSGSPLWKWGFDFVLQGGKGAPVKMPFGGEVISAKYDGGFGNSVRIKRPDGEILRISHLDSMNVKPGQKIPSGMVIGTQGNTGKTLGRTGIHLDLTWYKPDGSLYTSQQVASKLNTRLA